MAGNASLFELNTQEVVEMLKGQRMLMPVASLTCCLEPLAFLLGAMVMAMVIVFVICIVL